MTKLFVEAVAGGTMGVWQAGRSPPPPSNTGLSNRGTARARALGTRMVLLVDAVGRTRSDSILLTHIAYRDIYIVERIGPNANVMQIYEPPWNKKFYCTDGQLFV